MKRIQRLVDMIDDELEGAKCYAEMYVEHKAFDDGRWAGIFREMSQQELQHASYIHQLAVEEIDRVKKVFTAPVEMQEKWDKAHIGYVDRAAWIKQMLSM